VAAGGLNCGQIVIAVSCARSVISVSGLRHTGETLLKRSLTGPTLEGWRGLARRS